MNTGIQRDNSGILESRRQFWPVADPSQRLDKEGSISHELLRVSQRSRYQKVGHDLYNKNSQ